MENIDLQILETQCTPFMAPQRIACLNKSLCTIEKDLKKELEMSWQRNNTFHIGNVIPAIFDFLSEIMAFEEQSNDKFKVVIENGFTWNFVSRENIFQK